MAGGAVVWGQEAWAGTHPRKTKTFSSSHGEVLLSCPPSLPLLVSFLLFSLPPSPSTLRLLLPYYSLSL